MSLSTNFVSAVLIAFSLAAVDSVLVDSPLPQKQLKTYPLRNSPNSADMSPDEQWVVTECTIQKNTGDSGTKTFLEVVQLWNFKEDKLVAEFRAQQADVTASAGGYFSDPIHDSRFVRFSPDGSTVVALIDRTIHVLRARDLTEISAIRLSAPDEVTQTFGHHTVMEKPKIDWMEVSPNGDLTAVLWVRGMSYTYIEVQVYALASGQIVLSKSTPEGWLGSIKGLVWDPDGKRVLTVIKSVFPCGPSGCPPDVYALDVQSGTLRPLVTTELLPGSIAVSADGRLLVVDANRLGVLTNRNPKLKVFDLASGKLLREIPGRGTGVRYKVGVSADGSRFIAFTGKMTTKFDWLDFVAFDVVVDETFSVWSLKDYAGIVTSQNIRGLRASEIRLSAKGTYAFSYGKASFVYELP